MLNTRRILLSCANKNKLVPFWKELNDNGFKVTKDEWFLELHKYHITEDMYKDIDKSQFISENQAKDKNNGVNILTKLQILIGQNIGKSNSQIILLVGNTFCFVSSALGIAVTLPSLGVSVSKHIKNISPYNNIVDESSSKNLDCPIEESLLTVNVSPGFTVSSISLSITSAPPVPL